MISLICPLLYFLLANGLLVYITKKSFGKCIPLTFMLNAFIYFFSQVIFHTFKVGFYINIVLAIIPIVLIIYSLIRKKDLKDFKNNYFSKGFTIFTTIFILVFIFDFNRSFSAWDEWSHWGEMIKEMLRIDRFYSVAESTLMVHKDYPPIMQMFELFYTNLSGSFSEAILIRSVHLFSFTLFIPFFADSNKKSSILMTIIKTILIVLTIFLTILLFDQHHIINTIYIDYFMSILVAYLLATVLLEKDPFSKFTIFTLSIGFSFLLLLKQMGLPLYAMILFLYVAQIVYKNRSHLKSIFKEKNLLITLKVFIFLIVVPLLLWKGWSIYTSSLKLYQQFNLTDIKPVELVNIATRRGGEEWQSNTISKFTNYIITYDITNSYITLSYISCIVLFLLLIYGIHRLGNKYFDKEQLPLLAITTTIGFIGYAFVMLVLYIFSFGRDEAINLVSFDRYMSTYILIGLSVLIMLYIYIDSKKDEKNKSLIPFFILFTAVFLLQDTNNFYSLIPRLTKGVPEAYETAGLDIESRTQEKSKVFVLSQNTEGADQFRIKYYSGPRYTNMSNYSFKNDDIENYKDYFKNIYEKELMNYDYLYLYIIDDDFINNYGFLFDGIPEVGNLYKVSNQNGNIHLELLER